MIAPRQMRLSEPFSVVEPARCEPAHHEIGRGVRDGARENCPSERNGWVLIVSAVLGWRERPVVRRWVMRDCARKDVSLIMPTMPRAQRAGIGLRPRRSAAAVLPKPEPLRDGQLAPVAPDCAALRAKRSLSRKGDRRGVLGATPAGLVRLIVLARENRASDVRGAVLQRSFCAIARDAGEFAGPRVLARAVI